KDERFFFAIKVLLNHPSAKVRTLAIENLYFLNTENLCPVIEAMIHDKDQQVTTAAFRYLLKKYPEDPVELLDKYLSVEDSTIANASLVGLSMELRNNRVMQDRFCLEQRIENILAQLSQTNTDMERTNKILAVLETIGNAKVESSYPFIKAH